MHKFIATVIMMALAVVPCIGASRYGDMPVSDSPADTTQTRKGGKIDGVTVYGINSFQKNSSVNTINVNADYLKANFSGSLMQTLSSLPGIQAMSIGSGQSKPAIRGLGFNRMVVAEDGVKHEGQQWGDDHGLEIDQFAIDRVEVIKGPAALFYGSDAIGGVINLHSNYIPTRKLQGAVSLFTRSNNASLGASAKLEGRMGQFYYKGNFTAIDYADYKVPTDSIQYYSYFIRLKDHNLRNTAGKERDGAFTMGYLGYHFKTHLTFSDSYSKSGFFADAHGLEVRMSDIDYDKSRRDIDLPYQSVNHLKLMSHSVYQKDALVAEASLAFQNNIRQEKAEPVSHGYMPTPDDALERRFNKSTYAGNINVKYSLGPRHQLAGGIETEYQHNRRGGWGFIIPDFETTSLGAYLMEQFTVNHNLMLNAGVRYDYSRVHIHKYQDWYQSPVDGADSAYVVRSQELTRSFNSFTWSLGATYTLGDWLFKANVGKSFRMPIAKELGTDGVNYGIFRYEKGNPELDAEEAYQVDLGISWSGKSVTLQVEPYLNYFPNYIYLNPTAGFYEGLQMYYYTQSRVLRYGFEAQVAYRPIAPLELTASYEYLHARQQSGPKKGYSLPFTSPMSGEIGAKYTFIPAERGEGFVSLHAHITARQSDIVPPEKITAGHYTIGMMAGKVFNLGRNQLSVKLNAENLLNRKYYDHTSYYRLIGVPEPGRNVAIMVDMHF